MKWFEDFIAWLMPAILVDGTPWKQIWEEKDKESFLSVSRIVYPVLAVAYLAHYFFYDRAVGLEPIELWFQFRMVVVSSALLTFVFYLSPLTRYRWYKGPALVMCWFWCQTQAYVALNHGLESWVFCYIFIVGSVLALRLTVLKGSIFAAVTITTQLPVLIQANIPMSYVFTGSVMTLGLILVVRSSYLTEVRTFLLNQKNIATQKKIIELNIEFADRIRSFIPRVIAQRLENYVERERMTVLEASIEVLTARKRDVACLFSDIRGFTQGSKDLDEFISLSVIPEVKACSDAVENHGGIPRKVGDLIFAYFDETSIESNLIHAVAAGMEIARRNHDMNATSSMVNIRRYVLISCGEAIVGNLGGLDSSIEITALGSPVNYLSRVDELTKHQLFAPLLESGDLVLCSRSSVILRNIAPGVHQTEIELHSIGVSIRDFPEVRAVFTIKPDDQNQAEVQSAFRAHEETGNGIGGDHRLITA